MAVEKRLKKFTVKESLNSEVSTGWNEYAKGQTCNSGTNDEINTELTTTDTVLYLYCEELSSIGFDAQSGDINGNDSLRVPSGKVHKFLIPNGATHVHVEGLGASGNKYRYIVTG